MIEKIVLAIAIALSVYSIVQIKPPQRAVAVEIDFPQEILPKPLSAAVVTART